MSFWPRGVAWSEGEGVGAWSKDGGGCLVRGVDIWWLGMNAWSESGMVRASTPLTRPGIHPLPPPLWSDHVSTLWPEQASKPLAPWSDQAFNPPLRIRQDTVYRRSVRILLECILVDSCCRSALWTFKQQLTLKCEHFVTYLSSLYCGFRDTYTFNVEIFRTFPVFVKQSVSYKMSARFRLSTSKLCKRGLKVIINTEINFIDCMRSMMEGTVFTGMCQSFCPWGGGLSGKREGWGGCLVRGGGGFWSERIWSEFPPPWPGRHPPLCDLAGIHRPPPPDKAGRRPPTTPSLIHQAMVNRRSVYNLVASYFAFFFHLQAALLKAVVDLQPLFSRRLEWTCCLTRTVLTPGVATLYQTTWTSVSETTTLEGTARFAL